MEGRVKGVGTPPQVSHAVHKISKGFEILILGLKGPTMDSTGVLCLGGRCLAGLFALLEDLLSVGVAGHVVCLN